MWEGRIIWVAALLTVGSVLTGCGSDGAKKPLGAITSTTMSPAPATTAVTEPATSGPTESPEITSAVWSGDEETPVLTINGQGFGARPTPQPPGPPSEVRPQNGRINCNFSAGREGLDYGTELYVQTNDDTFSAGRYRPEIGNLDCVGLLIAQYSNTLIVLRFGGAYSAGRAKYNYTIRGGDRYEIMVKTAPFRSVVQYS